MTGNSIKRDVIVIGASIGGVQALLGLCEALPDDLPAIVGVVIHRSPWYRIDAAALYGHRSRIRVREGRSGDSLIAGTVYFAPSDHHMLFGASGIELSRGPRVHFVRPAVDMLFVSAATAFRDRVAGILLTGGGADGAHGLVTIKAQGGLSIVQRPSEAADPTMPLTGLREDSVDYVASLEELPSLLTALASGEPVVTRREPANAHPHDGIRKGKTDGERRQDDRKVSQSQH